jgi:hypothetical protein
MSAELADLQSRFTGFLRDPSGTPMPDGLPPERMRVYQDLVFRNVQSLLASNFPVLEKITRGGGHWDALTQGFIRDHRAHTPHFPLLALEFLAYLEKLDASPDKPEAKILTRYPFAQELAHYEWVELDVQIAPTAALPKFTEPVTLSSRLTLNPTAHVLAYQYPVHQIGPDFQPTEAPATPTFLAVYQNPRVQSEFILLTPMAALLLENVQQNGTCSTAHHIRILAQQHENLSEADLTNDVLEILEQLCDQGLIVSQKIVGTL